GALPAFLAERCGLVGVLEREPGGVLGGAAQPRPRRDQHRRVPPQRLTDRPGTGRVLDQRPLSPSRDTLVGGRERVLEELPDLVGGAEAFTSGFVEERD